MRERIGLLSSLKESLSPVYDLYSIDVIRVLSPNLHWSNTIRLASSCSESMLLGSLDFSSTSARFILKIQLLSWNQPVQNRIVFFVIIWVGFRFNLSRTHFIINKRYLLFNNIFENSDCRGSAVAARAEGRQECYSSQSGRTFLGFSFLLHLQPVLIHLHFILDDSNLQNKLFLIN